MIYIIRNNKWDLMDFLWDAIDIPHETVDLPPLLNTKKSNLLCKVAHVLWKVGLFIRWRYFENSLYEKLKTIKDGDHVIFTGYFARSLLNIYPYIKNKANIHLFFWDKVSNLQDYNELMWAVKKLNIDISTYDPEEAKALDIRFVPQQYNIKHFPYDINIVDIRYDLYYMAGTFDKARNEIVKDVLVKLSAAGFLSKVVLVDNVNTNWISYDENVRNAMYSRCIVEVNKPSQVGLTMRTMEALTMRKKLITNNKAIREYDFYNPHNIFIIGEDDESGLKDFVNSDYEDVDEQIIMRYDVNFWIQRICGNE